MAYTPIKTNDLEDVKLSYTTKQTFDILNNNASELDDRADRADAKFEAIEEKLDTIATGANKVEASATNGNIKVTNCVDGVDQTPTEVTVYTLPSDVVQDANYVHANNGTLQIAVDNYVKGRFTANQSGDTLINLTASDFGLSSAMNFLGTTTTPISDGSTQQQIHIGSDYESAKSGDVVLYNSKEFVWNGSSWEEFGDEGSYALKTVTITGAGALSGGGSLETNRTITHNAGNAASKTSGFYKFSTDAYSHVNSTTPVTKADLTGLIGNEEAQSGGADLSLVTTGEKATWNAKQNALATQTAYSQKGTATKVPTISTNTLGQVTAIKETEIAFPVTSVNGETGAITGLATTNYVDNAIATLDQTGHYTFTASDAGWSSTLVNGVYTLTITAAAVLNKHPFVCYNTDNEQVMATLGFNPTTGAITIKSDTKFAGTVYAI